MKTVAMSDTENKQKIRIGSVQQKLLLLLLAWVSISLAPSPRKQWRVLQELNKEWKAIDRKSITRSLASLKKAGLVTYTVSKSGGTIVRLSGEGKKKAKQFSIHDLTIVQPQQWDGVWRVVLFDIPEKFKNAREDLRLHLKRFGFIEYQKSVFVFPYPCDKEIRILARFLHIAPYVKIMHAQIFGDDEVYLKRKFEL